MRPDRRSSRILLSICLGFFMGCGQEPTVEKPLTPVIIQSIGRTSVQSDARYSATLAPGTQVDLAFKVGGYVMEIRQVSGSDGRLRIVQAGDRVRNGAILARLRESDYTVKLNQAKSNEADAKANFMQAKADFDRAQNLFATQSLTQADYDAARARYQSAQAKLDGAVESRKEADISVQDSTLKASFDGVIVKRNIEVGTLVSAGTVAFGLADTCVMKATFGVPDIRIQQLVLGRTLQLVTEAIPGIEFHGQITKIDPSADTSSRVFQIEVKIANPDDTLKPGMIGTVSLPGDDNPGSRLTVPLSAVVRPPGGDAEYIVYVVDQQDGRAVAHLRPVQLGPMMSNEVVVTAGVNQGESVVVKGTSQIVDGQQVRILR